MRKSLVLFSSTQAQPVAFLIIMRLIALFALAKVPVRIARAQWTIQQSHHRCICFKPASKAVSEIARVGERYQNGTRSANVPQRRELAIMRNSP